MSDTVMKQEAMPVGRSIVLGGVAGLVGGVLFGILMAIQGMLPMVGMLVRQENAVVGFIVHLVISVGLGALYGLIVSQLSSSWGTALITGAVYGVIWWVLGALLLMPLMLGMTQMVFVVQSAQVMSLIGHIIYGVATGAAFLLLDNRSS